MGKVNRKKKHTGSFSIRCRRVDTARCRNVGCVFKRKKKLYEREREDLLYQVLNFFLFQEEREDYLGVGIVDK